ncbi:hypothetical protein A2Y83_03105 [Candidatus Falkowbacteria bacterium RBG_13_39_14]|uniref:UDP-N-acetylmuramoyl-tripeptide--D-alanyl-D-alanine ligase n=1 Tax=Candidatus Falkowbacteria bacterium RBG_13_39_14 TaxID=1797985 RepID=A0A1F5S521_9BACT|nr:MAG: hypothetical protein A2Y83_03105 [Candidatus Falkowbacteria bacterium RBG_13_39_14]
MKSKKILLLEKILRLMAIAVLKKYNPQVVGITGSVGKTSAKEAAYLVLASKFRARKNIKNYNNEIGIPLTIIGAESGNKSFLKWLKVFFKWLAVIIFPCEYPEVLALEMGVDKPGDMGYLLDFVPVKVGVITSISPVHLEYFKSIDHIAKEKGALIKNLPEGGRAILNADDEKTAALAGETKAKVITYGFSEKARVRASDAIYISENNQPEGISFKLNYEGKSIPVRLRRILASHQICAALAAASAGIAFKINLVDIAASLEQFSSPPGRMNLIPGIKESLIIDDTYNSSPKAAIAALETLDNLKAPRKIAVLGDMLELGADEESGHKAAARKMFEMGVGLFAAVGERMKITAGELERLGYPKEKIFWFDNPSEAGNKLREIITLKDIILVKGSQSMRMEKAVEKIMAEPAKARILLCRQSAEWWKKPYVKP